MKPGEALALSLEQIEQAVAIRERVRLVRTLELAQGLATGSHGGEPWAKWQDGIIGRIESIAATNE